MLLLMEFFLCAEFSFKFGDNVVLIITVVVVDIINTGVLRNTIDVNIFCWQHRHCFRRHHGYCCHVNQRNQLTSSQSLSSSSLYLPRAYSQSANAKSTIYLCRIYQNLKKKKERKPTSSGARSTVARVTSLTNAHVGSVCIMAVGVDVTDIGMFLALVNICD